MNDNQILLLSLGLEAPWKLVDQQLDTTKQPHELHLTIQGERVAQYPCPVCGALCKAHDFKEKQWRHLNFFQHHCYIHASVPRVKCPKHGVKQVKVPWARKGSAFTLLFEQAAVTLAREMPVHAAARIIGIGDKRLWRIVQHYVAQAVARLDLSRVQAIALDEVRKTENRVQPLPKHLRWAVLKRGDLDHLTTHQLMALAELLDQGLDTATAWRVKERLRWVRQASTPRAAKWRITRFINYASALVGYAPLLEPVRKALQTLRNHAQRVARRWTSAFTNARLEGLNSIFQAARARARGYRNDSTFITMIHLIASPAGSMLKST